MARINLPITSKSIDITVDWRTLEQRVKHRKDVEREIRYNKHVASCCMKISLYQSLWWSDDNTCTCFEYYIFFFSILCLKLGVLIFVCVRFRNVKLDNSDIYIYIK
jgi:hypothetical protein